MFTSAHTAIAATAHARTSTLPVNATHRMTQAYHSTTSTEAASAAPTTWLHIRGARAVMNRCLT